MAVLTDRDPVIASEAERRAIQELEQLLTQVPGTTALFLGAAAERRDIPASVQRLLRAVVRELARGHAVSVAPVPADLTTQQAADLLNVSRPFLVGLLESGTIPFHRVGTHRRVPLDDLLAYRQSRSQTRRTALTELAREAQQEDIYE
jgi:excisionase family DNA binding protein